jgi:hypothetical protein
VSNSWGKFEADNWVYVKDKGGVYKTNLKANLQYEILSKADLSCVPNPAGTEVAVKLENCNKRATDECLSPFM